MIWMRGYVGALAHHPGVKLRNETRYLRNKALASMRTAMVAPTA